METTIQISSQLLNRLANMKMKEKESYENVIWDLIEDRMEFSKQTKINIAKSEQEIREGKVHKWKDVKKDLKINV